MDSTAIVARFIVFATGAALGMATCWLLPTLPRVRHAASVTLRRLDVATEHRRRRVWQGMAAALRWTSERIPWSAWEIRQLRAARLRCLRRADRITHVRSERALARIQRERASSPEIGLPPVLAPSLAGPASQRPATLAARGVGQGPYRSASQIDRTPSAVHVPLCGPPKRRSQ